MSIAKGYASNFETLTRAVKDGQVCIAECKDKVTGKTVIALCAVQMEGEEYSLIPLAKMFDGNPYEELDPPQMNEAA